MDDIQKILEGIEIEKIVDDIHNNKCILFLGPLMKAEYKGKVSPLVEIFCEQLLKEFTIENVTLNQGTKLNPYYVVTKYSTYVGGRTNLENKLKSHLDVFIKGSSTVYDALSKLPFNTIINFGSDRMMQNALNKNGYEFSDKYYNYNGKYEQYIYVDENMLLVYNLLGSVNDIDSQVLTEDDQLMFMKNIVRGPNLPDDLLSRMIENRNDSKSYIFLGFNFEEWPFRFLLDVLQLPKTKRSASANLPGYNIAFMTKEFYQDKFGLNFVELDPETFANKLIEVYKNKYSIDDYKNGFISYHDDDADKFKKFSTHLNNSKLGRRIKFWSKDQMIVGDNKEKALQEHFDASNVFIPLISSSFLYDVHLTEQVKMMLEREGALVFPIIISHCDYISEFEDILFKSKLILPGPGDEDVLADSTGRESSDDIYLTMIKKINSKIR